MPYLAKQARLLHTGVQEVFLFPLLFYALQTHRGSCSPHFFPPIHFRLRRLFLYSALGGGGKGRDDLSSSLRLLKKRRAE